MGSEEAARALPRPVQRAHSWMEARRIILRHAARTVLPTVWRMCFFTVSLAFLMCHLYNPIRRAVRKGEKATLMYYIFQDCDAFFTMCTTFVTFILSFFNATVFQRWWRLRELCGTINGRTVDTVVILSTYIHKEEELGELMRYLWLAHALHIYSIQGHHSSDDELLERLQQDGLLVLEEEVEALRICSSFASSTPLSVAYGWFTSRLYRTLQLVPSSCHAPLLQACQANVSSMRGAAGDVLMYLNTPVPLAYTHLLELTVTIYVMMAPIGLVPRLLWMAIPGCFIVTLVFYGFMSLGKTMLNPFANMSADGFDVQDFLRGTRSACREVATAVFRAEPALAIPAASASASFVSSRVNSRSASCNACSTLFEGVEGVDGPPLEETPLEERSPAEKPTMVPWSGQERYAMAAQEPTEMLDERSSASKGPHGKQALRVSVHNDPNAKMAGLRRRGTSPGCSPLPGPCVSMPDRSKDKSRDTSPSLFFGLQ